MGIRGVLIDFAGTLFTLEPDQNWLTAFDGAPAAPTTSEDLEALLRRLTSPPADIADWDDEHRHAWENRDLDPTLHRKGYLEVLRQEGLGHPTSTSAFYDRMCDPASWTPYPDSAAALRALVDRGIPVAVVSNIAFDIRPAFKAHGLDGYVDEFVLSFEKGLVKPDERIFRLALAALSVPADEALMIGDSETSDGGAAALGCQFARVTPGATAGRPDALLSALRAYGLV